MVLACVILGFIILIQNPKGGGLAGNVAGISNQFMGVKQTNDVLEKGTWIFVSLIALLSICSVIFMNGETSTPNDALKNINTNVSTAPSNQTPAQPTTPPASK